VSLLSRRRGVIAGLGGDYFERCLADGATLLLPMDEASGNFVNLVDSASLATTVTTYQVAGPGGANGVQYGAEFDGTNDHVNLGDRLGQAGAMTLEVWANNDTILSGSGPAGPLLGSGTTATVPMWFGNFTSGIANEVIGCYQPSGGGARATYWTGFTIPVGWHHHVLRYNGTQGDWNYLLDGVATGTRGQLSSGSTHYGTGAITHYIGRYLSQYMHWDGIAAVASYPSALSDGAIADHYALGA
jgi:hypothetical protein